MKFARLALALFIPFAGLVAQDAAPAKVAPAPAVINVERPATKAAPAPATKAAPPPVAPKNEPAEITALRPKAERGNAIAQYNLGLAYAQGRGIPTDLAEAFVWLTLASESGSTGKALETLLGTINADQLAGAREAAAPSTSGLSIAAAPPAEKPALAELRTNPERLRAAAEKRAATEKMTSPPSAASRAEGLAEAGPASAVRIHVVVAGDTLEKIAKKYYGDPGKWNTIYFANNAQLSGGRPLKPGMELEIPEN